MLLVANKAAVVKVAAKPEAAKPEAGEPVDLANKCKARRLAAVDKVAASKVANAAAGKLAVADKVSKVVASAAADKLAAADVAETVKAVPAGVPRSS